METIYTPRHALHATEHITLDGQPFIIEELPARAEILLEAVRTAALGPVLPPEDHGLDPLLAVHAADFIRYLQTAYEANAAWLGHEEAVIPGTFALGRREGTPPPGIAGQRGYYAFGTGSPILAGTWEAAYGSAQCALTAADRVLAGAHSVYALCRPPGHHAARDLCGGFCYLNNAAIAARYLTQHTRGRVAILDVDFHHGNGTQAIFYEEPQVFYASLHADPRYDYPFYWGFADERGAGAGLGTNLNLPLPKGTEDPAYLAALEVALSPMRAFAPETLVLSLGLDIAAGDTVGGMNITPAGFQAIGERIAAQGWPTVIIQEGGYRLDRLAENALAVLEAWA